MKHFGIGVAAWIVTMAILYLVHLFYVEIREYCTKNEESKQSRKKKKSVKASLHSVDENERSELSESEYEKAKRVKIYFFSFLFLAFSHVHDVYCRNIELH